MSGDPTFEQLPESLRLELLEHARRIISEEEGKPVALTVAAIEEVTGIGRGAINHRYSVAMMKLRRAALAEDAPEQP